jgi:hypothetical protein
MVDLSLNKAMLQDVLSKALAKLWNKTLDVPLVSSVNDAVPPIQ